MLTIESDRLSLQMKEDGSGVVLTDRIRGRRWRLDPSHQGYRLDGARDKFLPLAAGQAAREGDAIAVSYSLPGGEARFAWTLASDHAQVALQCRSQGVEFVSLPGAMFPAEGQHEVAIPVYQGLLLRGGGEEWQEW